MGGMDKGRVDGGRPERPLFGCRNLEFHRWEVGKVTMAVGM